ncbi:LysR family transcriptional regulator [Pseudalkalibacillus hwajinpoensis]|uniref:LysR family transcriptional regulator n=1 Tax=Guptibacillus hwajinpoensis TaxID=208199 RepID=A0A4U1MLD8_9BACL|nr:LysR family transcriptional regulator [Pseudalkalibacillus hwajinpoensis]TKD71352.1 LysR family transcriptional regulator [Pseudalkalibacillus hwajinpoensis]
MEIRHLEYFSEVAKQLSFTKAASTLHVSQPSISKAVKHLEDELGVPLFYRSKQLELTDAGRAVLVNAKHVLSAFRNLTSELSDLTELKKGEIKIGIPPIIGAAFFSKLISQFKELYPVVEIILTEVGSKRIKLGVEDGSLDIGLICNNPVHNENFESVRVINDPLMLIVPSSHPLAALKEVNLGDLEYESFILYREDFTLYDRIIEECEQKGFYPNIVCQSSQKDFMIEMVEAKLGVALLPSKIAYAIQNQAIKPLELVHSNVSLELGMIWKRNKYLPFAVKEFIKLSKSIIEN